MTQSSPQSQSASHTPLNEIREELLEVDSAEDRVEILIELGETLEEFSKPDCIEDNRVDGCQSMVWLTHSTDGQRLYFNSTSDAPMVQGLLAILMSAYSGQRPSHIISFDIESFFDAIHLKSFLSPLRSNGLRSIVKRIREIATVEAGKIGDVEAIQSVIETTDANRPVATKPLEETANDFPILQKQHSSGNRIVYLDNAATSQRPSSVINAMSEVYETHFSNVHRAGHEMANQTTTKMESAREAVRRFINAGSTEQVIFTQGTTAAINQVARAWGDTNLHAGDEILLSEMEHHSNIVPWQQLALRTGAVIRWLPVNDAYELDLTSLNTLLGERTKLVAITAVSNVLGTINPVAAIVEKSHAVGATVLVDAAQAIPHGGVDVEHWNADFVVFSGHKMLGPSGIGILYGRKSILSEMPPFLGGGNMIKTVTKEGFTTADLPHKFEAGTAPIAEAIAMQPAVEYLESVGSDQILVHEQTLLRHALQRLANVPAVKTIGPSPEKKSGVIAFTVDGIASQQIGELLDSHGIAIRVGHHCAIPLHEKLGLPSTCRASFYLYNTLHEVDRFVDALAHIVNRFGK